MNSAPAAHDAVDTPWHPPIELSRYDRTATLAAAERAALAVIAPRNQQWNQHRVAYRQALQTLARLRQPILETLTILGYHPRRHTDIWGVLAETMRQTGQAYWGWDDTAWEAALLACTHTTAAELRQAVVVLGFFLGDRAELHLVLTHHQHPFQVYTVACRIFGQGRVDAATTAITEQVRRWGYTQGDAVQGLHLPVAALLVASHSPHLRDVSSAAVTLVSERAHFGRTARQAFRLVLRVLVDWRILAALPLRLAEDAPRASQRAIADVPACWEQWCCRWRDRTPLAKLTRERHYYALLSVGRWLAAHHAAWLDPALWDYEAAATYVAALDTMRVGDWSHTGQRATSGQLLAPRTKAGLLKALRAFFHGTQDYGWLPPRFNPRRAFRLPKDVLAALGPNPRVIADDLWGKLLWAGLNLTDADLRSDKQRDGRHGAVRYPLPMVQAMAVVWLFAGLRADEFQRLPVGCVRWQRDDVVVPGTADVLPKDAVCFLDVPANKTAPPFTKPVDRVVGEAIRAWEGVRPAQPPAPDRKTGRLTQFLFTYRGKRISPGYINRALIPTLCRKANVPRHDARGPLTSHRARSTIANALYNAPTPMSLPELKEWLGHQHLFTTQYYVQISPLKQAKAFTDADYFGRMLRTVEVLVDKEAVTNGAAANGEPWLYYDLGHGYCTHPYFAQCPHRLVCAKCSFYRPKAEMAAFLAQAQGHLVRLKEEIALTEDERRVLDDDLAGYAHLLAQLAQVPALDGQTPQQCQAAPHIVR